MAMTEKERKQLLYFLIALPLLGAVAFYMYIYSSRTDTTAELQRTVDSLEAAVDSARQDLASGTVEEIRLRVADYEASLQLMRQLVPTGNEVATLINDISDRAKLRNIHIADLSPLGDDDAGRFRMTRYRFVVLGHYDEIGGFLSDIASLPRIMVPHQLSLSQAPDQSALALGDTTGALLQATFQLRTFVKPSGFEAGSEGGNGGAP